MAKEDVQAATVGDVATGRRTGSYSGTGVGANAGGGPVTEGARNRAPRRGTTREARVGMAPAAASIVRTPQAGDPPSEPARASQTTVESNFASVRSRQRST